MILQIVPVVALVGNNGSANNILQVGREDSCAIGVHCSMSTGSARCVIRLGDLPQRRASPLSNAPRGAGFQ